MTIEKQLADFKAEQDKRFEEFKASLVKPELNKWYGYNDSSIHLVYLKNLNGYDCYGFDSNGWQQGSNWTLQNLRPATPSEIQEALTKEAIKRGFKFEIRFNALTNSVKAYNHEIGKVGSGDTFDFENDELHTTGYGRHCIYKQGKWATIIKDEVIKIGGYEVKILTQQKTEIDGHLFSRDFWEAAKKISENSKAKIMIGCSKQFDVSLETINQILEKLK